MLASRRVSVIFNPNAGVGRFDMDEEKILKRIQNISRKQDVRLEVESSRTTGKGDCIDIAKDSIGDGCDVIAVAGGDGTIMEAANSLVGTTASLGIIPIGSGNDTIVSISGHNEISRCLEEIVRSDPFPLDVGLMNDSYFLNVVGIGLDAEINHWVAKRRKMVRNVGPAMTYTVAALNILARFKPHEISISVDGGSPEEHMISLCTVGNGTTCGGGYRLTPRAVMNDGKLDLSVSGFIGRIPSMLNIGKAYRGDHIKRKENTYTQFEELKINGLSGELPYHIDGEAGFSGKMAISVVRDGILCVHPHIGVHFT